MRIAQIWHRHRPRTVYDVLAAVGCVAALTTGGAYAANTIGSEDIIDESILSQDIRNGQVTRGDIAANAVNSSRVADGALTGADVANGSLTDADIDQSTLTAQTFADRFGASGNAAEGRGSSDGACHLTTIVLTAAQNALPRDHAPADGRLLPINQNQALFSAIGTTFGGDGRTNFALPDMRPIAPDDMTYGICIYGYFPSSN